MSYVRLTKTQKDAFKDHLREYLENGGKKIKASELADAFIKKEVSMLNSETNSANASGEQLNQDVEYKKQIINNISKWKNGNSIPDLGSLFILCDIMGCDIDYLFGRRSYRYFGNEEFMSETGLDESDINKLRQVKSMIDEYINGRGWMETVSCTRQEYFQFKKMMWILHLLINNTENCLAAITDYVFSANALNHITISNLDYVMLSKSEYEHQFWNELDPDDPVKEVRCGSREKEKLGVWINNAEVSDELIKTMFITNIKDSLDALMKLDKPKSIYYELYDDPDEREAYEKAADEEREKWRAEHPEDYERILKEDQEWDELWDRFKAEHPEAVEPDLDYDKWNKYYLLHKNKDNTSPNHQN